jgi:hypothetical protein
MNAPVRNLFLPLLLLCLVSCAVNPFRTAQTTEQKGDALYGQYVILKEQGAALLNDPTIADDVKRPLAVAMIASKDAADQLQIALIQYSQINVQLSAGSSSKEKLVIAEQNLARWLQEAQPFINQLSAAVGGLIK